MKHICCFSVVSIWLLFQASAYAQVRLPRLVSDSMIVQRDVPLRIWGWASPDEKISVKIGKKQFTTNANDEGDWEIRLPPFEKGAPFAITITGKNTITLQNVLAGDVWICAGQSNMVHNLDLHRERYEKEMREANFPEIRQFLVPTRPNLQTPQNDLPGGQWKTATSANIGRFSVVGYFFAKKLYDQYQVPIGIINASVGGTPIEAWISEDGLKQFPALQKVVDQNRDTAYVNRANAEVAKVNRERENQMKQDLGLTQPAWYDNEYVPKFWRSIMIPGYWEDQGIKDLDGIVWYRKEIELPPSASGKQARLYLGRIVDADEVYVNGKRVGGTTYQYPQRRYQVPAGFLRPGKNVITIRVINYSGKGGFVPEKPYRLVVDGQEIELKGEWQYKVGYAFRPTEFRPGVNAQNQPTALFNGMVAPLTKFAMKGFVWYQGESNVANPGTYSERLSSLIKDWRKQWSQGVIPFVYAQLPDFQEVSYLPIQSNWAELRDAQRQSLHVPSTGMAVTIGLGEWNDIHPGNKKPVGERLALAAQRVAYADQETVTSGPLYRAYRKEGNKIIISFDYVGSGLTSHDGEPLNHFAVAGDDGKFVWANATVKGDQVEVWSNEISSPKYVRYAWADNPAQANLSNKEGLPASPFEIVVDKN